MAGTSSYFPFAIEASLVEGDAISLGTAKGEVGLCWALDGEPEVKGTEPGWLVLPPGDACTPKVQGGSVLVLSFLPDGAARTKRRTGRRGAVSKKASTRRKTATQATAKAGRRTKSVSAKSPGTKRAPRRASSARS